MATKGIPIFGSKFYIVINSQQPESHGNLELFTDIIKRLVLTKNIFKFLMWRKDKNNEWTEEPNINQLLKSMDEVRILSNVEIGPIFKKVHANITFSITHYHQIALNIPKFRAWIRHLAEGKFKPNIKIENRSLWPSDRRYALKDYGYIHEFEFNSKFYDVHGKTFTYVRNITKP